MIRPESGNSFFSTVKTIVRLLLARKALVMFRLKVFSELFKPEMEAKAVYERTILSRFTRNNLVIMIVSDPGIG